ncbi:MAG TPA: cyclic nucleotide-binding domain-containing protein [Balneolales bacterium]|nr:cyclic nucleotide-binding domain-containing protein [Balneolales bacterium]
MEIDITWLEENVLLHKLQQHDIDLVKDLFSAKKFSTGDEIIRQGDSGIGLQILRSGNAGISFKERGRSIFLAEVSEAALFGEISFFSGGNSSATVTAYSDCITYELTKQNYCKLIIKNQDLLMSLLTHMVTCSSNIIKSMNLEKIQDHR